MKLFALSTLVVLAAASPAAAQQAVLHDALLDRLQGSWVITGTIASAKTTHDLTADWVMNHQYLRLHEVSREREKDGRPKYEATVYIGWNQKTGTYGCVWLDDYGGLNTQSIGRAAKSGDKLPFVFTNLDGSATRTTMTWHPESRTWDWTIVEDRDGKLSTFASLALQHPALSK
jgi:hypothetical protein